MRVELNSLKGQLVSMDGNKIKLLKSEKESVVKEEFKRVMYILDGFINHTPDEMDKAVQ